MSKITIWVENSVDADQGLHCFLMPVYSNILVYYGILQYLIIL